MENHQTLLRLMVEVQQGWKSVDQFKARMQQFGSFDLDGWAVEPITGEHFVQSLVARTTTALTSRERLLPWAQYLQAAARARNGRSEISSSS